MLTTRQLGGEHLFAAAGDLGLHWQYTDSNANRDMPFARSSMYTLSAAGEYVYTLLSGPDALGNDG